MGLQVDESLPGGIELLGVHDHACLVYGGDEDPAQSIARFIQAGLHRGDLCIYLPAANAEAVAASLATHGVDVEGALATGRLVIESIGPLPGPEEVRVRFEQFLRMASQVGASVLRIIAEPLPSGDANEDPNRLLYCEAASGAFFASTNSIGLSLYHRDRIPPRMLRDVIRCHPILIVGGSVVRNFYHVPPDELLGPLRHEREVDRLLSHLHERQAIEYRLRDQIRQNQLMLQTSLDGFYRMTLDGTIIEANDAFAAMVGYPRKALQGLNVRDLQPEVPPEQVQRRIDEVARAGSGRYERRYRRRDGGFCDVSISANLVSAGGQISFVAFCRDITEHNTVVTALHESERRYRQMLENTRLLACTVDAEGRVTFCNDYFETLTGWSRDELVGRNWFECLVPEEERPSAYSDFLRIGFEQADLPFHTENEILTRSGERRAVVWTTCTLRGANGQVVGVATIGVDITERKRAEADLRESEERFRELAELLPEIVYEMNARGVLTFANRRAFEVTKYTKEDFDRGILGTDLLAEVQRGEAERHLKELLGGAQFANREYTVCTKDGRLIPVMARMSMILRDGRPVGVRGILFDITDRKKAEEALQRNEARTRAILKAIPDLIFLNDKNGTFLEFHSGESQPVLPPKEFLGCRMRDVMPAELSTLCDAFDRTAKTGRPEKIEYPLTLGGKLRYFEARIVPCHEDTVLTVIREITDRRLAEEALVRARDFHLTLLEEFPSLVWRADADGTWDYFNRTWLAFTGRTLEQEKGEGWTENVHPEDSDRCLRIHRAAFEARAPFELEYRLRRCDGEYRWVTDIGRPFNDLNGRFAGYVGSCYDITDRKNAEAERRKLEGKIKHTQKLESLGVLAGGIAHDFNNLLTGILGHADLALLDLLPDSPAYDSLRQIETAARRAAELTKQLLAYSGKGRFVVTFVNLSRLIEEMVHLLDVSISKKCIVQYECAPELPAIEADASQIRQIVMNLIINASEAIGDQSGLITVRTKAVHCTREYLSQAYLDENLPEGLYVCLEVIDNGCGMSETTRTRIFDPFFTTKFTGRGLGLAAVLGIVRGHHGAIQVTSEPGSGTTFRALLPASLRKAADNDSVRRPGPTWKSKGVILVADDEGTVRNLASKMLEKAGFTVITANDGQECVELFEARAKEIRAVLLDVTMPRMDGREAFYRLQAIRPGVPVILSSGFNEQDVTHHIEGTGLVGFVQKPYVTEELLQVLRHALEKH